MLALLSPDKHSIFLSSLKDLLPAIIRHEHSQGSEIRYAILGLLFTGSRLSSEHEVWIVPLENAVFSVNSIQHLACLSPDIIFAHGDCKLHCLYNTGT